jgi:hypothetical protein
MDQLHRSNSRPGAVASFTGLALAATLALGLASPAAALPTCVGSTCTMEFTGNMGFGISEADALALVPFGFEIVPSTTLTRAEMLGVDLDVFDVEFNSRGGDVIPFPSSPTGPNVGIQHYQVENVSGGDLLGDNYFLVTKIIEDFLIDEANGVTFPPTQVDYRGTAISLVATADPWLIVQVDAGAMGEFFYPAYSLGSLNTAAVAGPFNVTLKVDGPLVEIVTQDGVFAGAVLPQLQHGSAFTLIPEPSAAVLFAAGMLGLTAFARRTHRGGS